MGKELVRWTAYHDEHPSPYPLFRILALLAPFLSLWLSPSPPTLRTYLHAGYILDTPLTSEWHEKKAIFFLRRAYATVPTFSSYSKDMILGSVLLPQSTAVYPEQPQSPDGTAEDHEALVKLCQTLSHSLMLFSIVKGVSKASQRTRARNAEDWYPS